MINLHKLVYVSTASVPFSESELEALAMHAGKTNQKNSITGVLYFEKGYFLQYLEGSHNSVMALMERIKKDARHRVDQIVFGTIHDGRKFPNWHMHNLRRAALIKVQMDRILLKNMLMLREDFIKNPKRVSNSIWSMIEEMSEYRSMLA